MTLEKLFSTITIIGYITVEVFNSDDDFITSIEDDAGTGGRINLFPELRPYRRGTVEAMYAGEDNDMTIVVRI